MPTPDRARVVPDWRDVAWEEVARDVDVDGRRVHLVDLDRAGDGSDVVVLLHGVSASWRWFLPVLPDLALTHRAVAVDLPGFGGSQLQLRRSGFDGLAHAVADTCSALGVDRAAVVGHSMGSLVATRLAVDRPELVDSLVITGGPILSLTGLGRHPLRTVRAQPWAVATLLTELATIGVPLPQRVTRLAASSPTLLRLALGPFLAHPERLDPDLMAHVMSALGAPGSFPALLSALRGDPNTGLDRIACPTRIIRGPGDPLAPRSDVEAFLAAVPTASAVEVPGTGHWPHIEDPETFLAELRAFLAEPGELPEETGR
ncbi:alpha/beta fold hydrolase [Rhodococcus aerolatus]